MERYQQQDESCAPRQATWEQEKAGCKRTMDQDPSHSCTTQSQPVAPVQALTVFHPLDGPSKLSTTTAYFLDQCYQCAKRFKEDDSIYMYGDFRAFCSIQCRDRIMDLEDGAKEDRRSIVLKRRKCD